MWFQPPGWRPADVAGLFPKPPFELQAFALYDPPMSGPAAAAAGALFLALLLEWGGARLMPLLKGFLA